MRILYNVRIRRGNGIVTAGGAMIGGLLAFLIFNAYPAKVFMGDTGSLALGGFIVACAFILKMPLFILYSRNNLCCGDVICSDTGYRL